MSDFDKKLLSEKSYMVMAGAGAGKTTRLVTHIVENFISFKAKHGRWPRIVGTTFTKKAASEIQDRVSILYKKYDDPEIFDFAYSSHLNIGTVHSLCLKLLRSKLHLLGFSKDIRIVGSESFQYEKRKLLFDIINTSHKNLLKDYGFNTLIKILNFMESQKDIQFQPISLEAQTLILNQNIKNAYEVFEAHFNKIIKSDHDGIKNSNLAFDYLLNLRRVLIEGQLKQSFKPVLDFFETQNFRKPTYKLKSEEAQINWQEIWEYRNSIKKDLEDNYYKLYDSMTFSKLATNSKSIFDIHIEYNQKIAQFKRDMAMIEMSDIEPLALELLKTHKEKCKDFIEQWDYYYIDEYQDTNNIQKEIFDILLQSVCYFKVGDPQQSIYLFRGAKSSIYEEEFQAAKNNENIELDFLETNYRSEKNLLLGVNELFNHIDAKNFRSMNPYESDSEVEMDKPQIFLNINLTEAQEKELVINDINKLISCGVDPSEICILARTKSILYSIEYELQKREIPAVLLVSGNYENRKEVRQCLNFLSFLEDPDDDHILFSVLKSKIFNLNDDKLIEIFKEYKAQKPWSLWAHLKSDGYNDLPAVIDLNKYLEIFKRDGLVEVFKAYLLNSNILNIAKNSKDLNRRHSNLYKLLTEVITDNIEDLTLSDSLKSILSKKTKSQSSEAIFSSSNSGVKLMTIHGSKGLEFEHVLVVGCHVKGNLTHTEAVEVGVDGAFVAPFSNLEKNIKVSGPLLSITKNLRISGERQETLRQIYVAATRAKKNLYFYGQARLGDNSIYRNMKLDLANKFSWISIFDPENPKVEKEAYSPRLWDFDSNKNELRLFDTVHIAETENELDAKRLQILDSKFRFQNISVTKMVNEIVEKSSQFKFEVIQETAICKFELQNLNYSFQKRLVGEIFHKYLELYANGLDLKALEDQYLQTYLGNLTELSNVIKSLLKVQTPHFSDLFKTARVEWGFNSCMQNKYLVSGQIDLWGVDSKGVIHIVDYKSGRSVYQKKSAAQVHIYKDVLKKIYPKSQIQTHLLYISEGKLVTLTTDFKVNS